MSEPEGEGWIGGEPPREVPRPPAAARVEGRENEVVSWAKAILGGIKDTARDMAREAREAAHETSEKRWQEFEAKTKHRREPHKRQ